MFRTSVDTSRGAAAMAHNENSVLFKVAYEARRANRNQASKIKHRTGLCVGLAWAVLARRRIVAARATSLNVKHIWLPLRESTMAACFWLGHAPSTCQGHSSDRAQRWGPGP